MRPRVQPQKVRHPVATISRLSGPRADCSAAGGEETLARGNSVALCVVVPDMPRLSLDGALGPREKRWMEVSNGGETISG